MRIFGKYGVGLFSTYPEIEMEISMDGELQEPRVLIQPVGFSRADKAAFAGHRSEPGENHCKGYVVPAGGTAVQAAILRPAGSGGQGWTSEAVETNPFLLEMILLGISPAVRDLPKLDVGRRPKVLEETGEVSPLRHENLFDKDGYRFGTRTEQFEDKFLRCTTVPGL